MKTNKTPKLNVNKSILKNVSESVYLTNSFLFFDNLKFKYLKESPFYGHKSFSYEGIRKQQQTAVLFKKYISKNKTLIILKLKLYSQTSKF